MKTDRHTQDKAALDIANKWAKAFIDATNSHDASRIASLFTEDADRVNICENQVLDAEYGRSEIEVNYGKLFADEPSLSQDLNVESSRFLSPELMLIDGTWSIQNLHDGKTPGGRFIVINKYEAGRWLLISSRILFNGSTLQFFNQHERVS